MAIICDRLLPYQSDRRDAALLQQIRQDRRKRGIIIQQLTREALATVHPRLSDKDDTVTNYVISLSLFLWRIHNNFDVSFL